MLFRDSGYLAQQSAPKTGITPTIWFDPGNTSSYSGSGTTVRNLIGGGAISGTMSNVTYYSSTGAGAFAFNGFSSVITFSTYNFGTTMTLIVWVMPIANATISCIMSNCAANTITNGFKMYWNSWTTTDRKLLIEAGNGSAGSNALTNSAAVVYGSWQHVAICFNTSARTASFYVNGVVQASGGTVTSGIGTNQSWWIGAIGGSSYWLNSLLSIFKIYNTVLSATDIQADYTNTRARYGV